MKHRGAVGSPPVTWRRPLRSTLALFASKWWTIGMIVALASWGLHVAALALAPITLVQSVIAGGLVLLTVIAERIFKLAITRREWIGVGLTAAGLAFLAATLGDTAKEAHSDYDLATLVVYLVILAAGSAMAIAFAVRLPARAGIMLAAAAGLQWGASDVAIKALSDESGAGILVVIDPLAAVIAGLSLVGLIVSARSLQIGSAVPVIAVTSAAANLATIASGLIVFGEPLPDDPLGVVVRLAAFVLVIGAAALTPAPVPRGESAVTTPARAESG